MNDLVLTAKEKQMLVQEVRRAAASYLADAKLARSQRVHNEMAEHAHDLLVLASHIDGTATIEELLDSAYADVRAYEQHHDGLLEKVAL